MFERFTDQARQAVINAQTEAGSLHYGYLGTEHLLLGLLYNPADLPAQVLARHGVELANAREQVEDVIGERRGTTTGHITFTPRAKTILEIAFREAQQLRHDRLGSGHLLLALIHEGQGIAAQVLRRLGTDLVEVETDVIQQLPGPYTDTPATLRERVLPAQQSRPDQPTADLATRLATIDETLTTITARLDDIEHRLTDQ